MKLLRKYEGIHIFIFCSNFLCNVSAHIYKNHHFYGMQQGCYCRYNIFIYTYLPIDLHCTNVKYLKVFITKNIQLSSVYYFCALYCFSVLCDDAPKCRLSYDSLGIFSLANPENKARILLEVSLSPSP